MKVREVTQELHTNNTSKDIIIEGNNNSKSSWSYGGGHKKNRYGDYWKW